jgi:hypothetical protein
MKPWASVGYDIPQSCEAYERGRRVQSFPGEGASGRWGGRYLGSAARQLPGWLRRTPLTTSPEILCQAGFLFSKSAFRSTQHSTSRGSVTLEQLHIIEHMCTFPPPRVRRAALPGRQRCIWANACSRSTRRSVGASSPILNRTRTPSRRAATVLGGFTGTARLVTPPQLQPISNS